MTEPNTADRTVATLKQRPPATSKATGSASPIASSAHRQEHRLFCCSTFRATSTRGIPPS